MDKQILNKKAWKKFAFGEISREIRKSEKEPLKKGIKRYVGLEHIETEDLHIRSWGEVADGTTFSKTFIKGQLLFGRRRAYLRKAAVADFDGICSGDILVFEANEEKVLPEFFPFIVQNDRFFNYAVDESAGSLSPRVSYKDLANYKFLLPPLSEQKKLADLLWAGDKVLQRYRDLERELGITQYSYIKSYVNESKKTVSLDSLAKIVMGQSPPGESYNVQGDGIPFLQGNAEFSKKHPKHIKYTNDPKKYAQTGDLLISVRAPVGDMNYADQRYCIGRGLAAIRSEKYPNAYFYFLLKHLVKELERISSGSTFNSINKDDLINLQLPMNSEEKTLQFIENTQSIEDSSDIANKQIKIFEQLIKSLINKIFG